MKTITYDETQWKLVPVEPTKGMRDVITSGIRHDHMVSVYQAMLAAAPTPPASGQAQQDDDKVDSQPYIGLEAVRIFWQQHTMSDALSMDITSLHDDVEKLIRSRQADIHTLNDGKNIVINSTEWGCMPEPVNEADIDPAMAGDRNERIIAAMTLIRQDYGPESTQTTRPREYVHNAVMQLIDAGYGCIQPASGDNLSQPDPVSAGDERAAFERFVRDQNYLDNSAVINKFPDGDYTSPTRQKLWEYWQAASKRIQPASKDSQKVSPSEAVYAFAAWLTCREQAVTFGSAHEASPAAELVNEFVLNQGWEQPRDDYISRLKKFPSESVKAGKNDNKPRAELLQLAENKGAIITGKPDGSEPITIVFSVEAWRSFDAALQPNPASGDAELLDWLATNLFERKWDGTIGSPCEWYLRGDWRHIIQHMKGADIRTAITAAMQQEPKP